MAPYVERLSKSIPALRNWLLKQPFFTSKVLPVIPRRARWALRTVYFAPLDLIERLRGDRDPMSPPHSVRFTGNAGEDFLKSGEFLMAALCAGTHIEQHSKVLDIGSGMGRLAVSLTRILEPPGSYDGIDIVKSGIDWCSERITPRFPHFRFTLADVKNGEYNPGGTTAAVDYSLPYPDNHFDAVVLYSVFTHMRSADMEHYVAEIARVLKEDGRCLATYMLINPAAQAAMASGTAIYDYKHHIDNYWLLTPSVNVPELNIGYDEPYVRETFTRHGFEAAVFYGDWSGKHVGAPDALSPLRKLGQDVVLARKKIATPLPNGPAPE